MSYCCDRCNCHLDSLARSFLGNIPVELLTPTPTTTTAVVVIVWLFRRLCVSQRSAAKVRGRKGNFGDFTEPLGELGFLFISTTFSDLLFSGLDKQELSFAVKELRHQRSRG